jgi:eukaryotic-like serine/threonine-protein kinase
VLVYATSPETTYRLSWFDRTGRLLETIRSLPFGGFASVNLSPDGTQIAMQSPVGPDPNADIWLFDVAQRRSTQLTFAEGSDRVPIWSPDGQWLVFASLRSGAPGMYRKRASGEQPEERLLASRNVIRDEHWPSDWSSAGIVYTSGLDFDSDDVWMLPLTGDRKPRPLVREPGSQSDAKVSPDGRWLAYTHRQDRTTRPVVYVYSLATGGKWRISTAGGDKPRWRRDGKELFYVSGDGKLMAVPVDADATTLRLGVSRELMRADLLENAPGRGFGVFPDGQRFLVPTVDDPSRTPSIVVVSNWPAMLKQSK